MKGAPLLSQDPRCTIFLQDTTIPELISCRGMWDSTLVGGTILLISEQDFADQT